MKKLLILKFLLLFTCVLSAKDIGVLRSNIRCASEEKLQNLLLLDHLSQLKKNDFKYVINVAWILKKADFSQEFLYSKNNYKKLVAEFLWPIVQWARKHSSNAEVFVWYDGRLLSAEAVTNTKYILDNYNLPIFLKDIRELEYLQYNPELVDPRLPVYFRADIARVLIMLDQVLNQGVDYSVYADIDMPALDYEELFDEETLYYLQQYGIVLADALPQKPFENGFQILSSHNKYTLKALADYLIETNHQRAKGCLAGLKRCSLDKMKQAVYYCYPYLFRYLYCMEKRVPCSQLTDPIFSYKLFDLYIPTKKVKLPVSRFKLKH